MEFERRCWAQVNLDALRHNFNLIRQYAKGAAVMAVVKADAYGHGDVAVARLLDEAGAAQFAVSGFEEAVRLRQAGITKPVLILGYTGACNAAALAAGNIAQTVFSLEYARALSAYAMRAGVTVSVHFKVDTGMGRLGFAARDNLENAVQEMAQAYALPGLTPVGVFTHFAVADSLSPDDLRFTARQYEILQEAIRRLAKAGRTFAVAHCCNSAGVFAWPDFHLDLVRPGIILYGENPSDEVRLPGLQPALQLQAVVTQVKQVPAGDNFSYGRTFTSEAPMRIATLAAGYADGYPRALSGRGVAALHGKPARVVGRVCMDQIMIDVTCIPDAAPGDVATLFGGDAADSVADVARATGTIPYEVLCDIGRRVQRVYTQNGKEIEFVDYLQ